MEPAYYKEYYRNERKHWWFVAREFILRRQLERMISKGGIPSHPRILNIGAATGRTSQWLGELGHVLSLENDKDCCRLTKERTGLEIVEGTILDLPWESDSFDVVCAFDVIEHVEDDVRAAAEMKRVCRKNGILFVTVPASPLLWSEHDEINHHIRRYQLNELKALFKGFDLLFCSGFNSILYLPILVYRILHQFFNKCRRNWPPRPLKSDFSLSQPYIINLLLENIFKLENLWLSFGVRVPWGVSFMMIARRRY